METLIWDSKDDYFNTFFKRDGKTLEIVVRSYEKSYLFYVEDCESGEVISEKEFDEYCDFLAAVMLELQTDAGLDIPSKVQLHFAEFQHAEHDNVETYNENSSEHNDYEICTECCDPDCIPETGGCNE